MATDWKHHQGDHTLQDAESEEDLSDREYTSENNIFYLGKVKSMKGSK